MHTLSYFLGAFTEYPYEESDPCESLSLGLVNLFEEFPKLLLYLTIYIDLMLR